MQVDEPGLRERKRQRTYETISAVAVRLFLERGFDAVSVAEVSAAAEVSKPTLFKYFPTKEDLVIQRFSDRQDQAARVVRERKPGQSPVDAVHESFVAALSRRDPLTGLTDNPQHLAFYRLIQSSPSLATRMRAYFNDSVLLLAEALREAAQDDPHGATAELAAEQIVATQWNLANRNWRWMCDGGSADELFPDAVAIADHGFDLLRNGISSYYG